LNFLVQICQELGQPYEEYNAQFIRLKRAQEAEEDAGFNFGQGGDGDGYQQQNVYQPQGGFYQQQQQDSDPGRYQQAPTNRGQPMATPRQQQARDEEEGWGNDDLLPD
jgi:hypothetical protein